jgi:hypothetical protein
MNHPDKLEEAFDVSKCEPYLDKIWSMGNICWNCLLTCPYGKKDATPRYPTEPVIVSFI